MRKEIFPITKNNHLEFYRDGRVYNDKYLSCIKNAKESIHLQTYIFEIDLFGEKVQTELINATKRGVKVFLLVDGVGSRNLTKESEAHFKSCGVNFCRFNSIQIKWLYRWGRRLHHKILLIDEKEAIIGGINVLTAYAPEATTPQLDFAVHLKGPSTVELANYCKTLFKRASQNALPIIHTRDYIHINNGHEVGISINDWVHGRSKITRQYGVHTANAQKQITIINSYFFPRKKFMKQLTDAAARGVRVRLVLPKYSDWPSYILASEYLYDYFLRRGVEIYRWEKSVLHGKLATVDEGWTTIGSFNLNYTSYQQNLEMNVDVYSHDFNRYINKEIESIITDGCEKLDAESFQHNYSLWTRASRLFFYLILSIVANFSIGLSFQEEYDKEHRFFHILRIVSALFFFMLGLVGSLLPVMPGFPFFIISFLLVYRQILHNKKTA